MKQKPKGRPVMDLVGGPQGSGKSTFFPVSEGGHDSFNIDDHRRSLNKGSSQSFPKHIQDQAAADYESFIDGHIDEKRSFSIEVTLGREITFDQARRAKAAGFSVHLTYIAADIETCVKRMANRVDLGGHGVKEAVLRKTHAASMRNIARAIREFDAVEIYDNSSQASPDDLPGKEPRARLILSAQHGTITSSGRSNSPGWLRSALKGTEYALGS